MKEIVLVDGYNIIGDWPELKEKKSHSLLEARDLLIERMAEYQAITGKKVIIVFDAHMVHGTGQKMEQYRVEVIYTKQKETADERIEKLVSKLKNVETKVYVATSDQVEQSLVFGSGALRIPARELRLEMNHVDKDIHEQIENSPPFRATSFSLSKEVAEFFDKRRRNGR